MNLGTYAFSKQPGFVETELRKVFKHAVPLRTVVVYCYDPRAVNIPYALAKAMPGEDPSSLDTPEQAAEAILKLCLPSCSENGKIYDYKAKKFLA